MIKKKREYKKEIKAEETMMETSKKMNIFEFISSVFTFLIKPNEIISRNKTIETKSIIINSFILLYAFVLLFSLIGLITISKFTIENLIFTLIMEFISTITFLIIFTGVSGSYWIVLTLLGSKINFEEQTKNIIPAFIGFMITFVVFLFIGGIIEYGILPFFTLLLILLLIIYYLYLLYIIIKTTNETTTEHAIIAVLTPLIIGIIIIFLQLTRMITSETLVLPS